MSVTEDAAHAAASPSTAPDPPEAAADLAWEDLSTGLTVEHRYSIEQATYDHFLAGFADHNPLHVNAEEARARGFAGPVMHGAILNGFLSHFVGMKLPGRRAMLLSADVQYSNPCYLGDRIIVTGKIVQVADTVRVVVMHLRFYNESQSTVAAKARVQAKVVP